jgi:predicted RNase H-like nuclease (RuvC/YqgF family)
VETIIAAISAVVAAVLGLVGSVWASKRFKIGPNSERLIELLQDTINAQDRHIKELELTLHKYANRIEALETRVKELEAIIIAQEVELNRLKSSKT